jgi:CcmD family protein
MNLYLFAGYLVIWTILFLYIVFLERRQQRLHRELEALSREVSRSNSE